jgi:hypothetical protein
MIRAAVENMRSYSAPKRRAFGTPVKPKTPTAPGWKPAPATTPDAATAPAAALSPLRRTDSIYDDGMSRIATTAAGTEAGLTDAENALGLTAGINFDRENVDLNGDGTPDTQRLTNFRIAENVDVSNPFSQAAALQRIFRQNQQANTNGYAARGQLYSGALQRAQDHTAFGFQQGQDSLLKSFGERARELFAQRYGVWSDAEKAKADEEEKLTFRNVQAGPQPTPPETSGAQMLAALGGTLVIKNGKRYVRRPDGLYDLNGNRVEGSP